MSPAALLYDDDLIDPTYHVDADGLIAVPTAAGLGYPVREDLVRARTVRRAVLDGSGNLTVFEDERSEA
jgi:L-alanine-DL-glutamate epimerase-like enolase superfamily enzyme